MDEDDDRVDREFERRKRKKAFLDPAAREVHEKRAKRLLGVKAKKDNTLRPEAAFGLP